MKLWCSLLLLGCSAGALAVGPNPSHDWRSFDSQHFVVHFEAEDRPQAVQAAAIAERVLPGIVKDLRWQPRSKTHLILFDDYDLANGFATPLPFSHTGIFLTPPDDGELLENSDWLELVITHELVHIVHLDKVRGAPKFLQNIFGRYPLLFPNAWQPTWLIEGLATYYESEPSQHRGRLDNALFDAYMRLEVQSGVKSLREINSSGRAFPINKAYLYGAYFYRFLEQRYGADAVFRLVDGYSDNIIPFRVHSNPVAVTKKPMDELWLEFQQWLNARFAGAEKTAGKALLSAPSWQLETPVLGADGELYAVADDGVSRPYLSRLGSDGEWQPLQALQAGARIDRNSKGELLIAQPEICNNYHYYYDLYRWTEAEGLTRLSQCGRYRFAAWRGDNAMVALRNDSGRAAVVLLDREGNETQTLYQAADAEALPALAVSADGARVAWLSKQAGQWRVQEMQLADGRAQTLLHSATALLSLRYVQGSEDLLWVRDQNGVFNAERWSRADGSVIALTDANAAVLAVSSTHADRFVSLQLVQGGYQLYEHALTATAVSTTAAAAPAPLASASDAADVAPAETRPAITTAPATESTDTPSAPLTIQDERDYSALETLAPRAWFPTAMVADGALAFGVELFGQDAVGWHQYTLSPQYEFSEGELLGSLVYGYDQRHFFAVFREMEVTDSIENDDDEDEIVSYELRTAAQWISMAPWLRLDHRLRFGIGAAMARETYELVDVGRITLQDEKLAAAFFSYDSRRGNWWSEGNNSGQYFSLLAESYDPFDGEYEGRVYRADWRGQFALGHTSLALRLTEAKGEERTEPFELGGSYNSEQFGIPRLNERDLALRGYDNGEPELTGKRARIAGIEWRTPLVDLDRHLMVPPIGLNRLSAALFYEAGAAWTDASKPEHYYRSAGVELLAELKLGYRLGLLLRAGYARGLDEPGGDEVYLQLGRSF